MRIGFVCASASTVAGGIETTVLHLAREMSKRHEVLLVTGASPTGGALSRERFNTIELPFLSRGAINWPVRRINPYGVESMTFYAAFRSSFAGRRALGKVDVISTHAKYDSLFFSRWGASRGIPSVFHLQGSTFGHWFQRLDRSARYVAVSEITRQDIRARFGLKFAAVVPPGVPDELLQLPRAEEDAILLVARLQRSKGTLESLLVLAELRRSLPRLRLRVIGDGPDRSEMERIARRLGVADAVEFYGALPHAEVLPHYCRAKLFLFPSRWEVFPIAPLEALAAGCPVIAADTPALRESTGGSACLLPLDDIPSWVEAAKLLLRDPAARLAMGLRGRAWAASRTWSSVGRVYEKELTAAAGDAL